MIVDAYKERRSVSPPARPAFRDGASQSAIAQLEKFFHGRLPMSLRSLLSQTDGVEEEIEIDSDQWIGSSSVIYSVNEMIDANSYIRRAHPNRIANRFCFFSAAGTDGILFGFDLDRVDREDASVLAWYPDETADKCMADGLLPFIIGWCSGTSTV